MQIDQFLDTEYDNLGSVPEHTLIFERWQKDSQHARKNLNCKLDLAYGKTKREKLDIFYSSEHIEKQPLIVYIHGGYWKAMDKQFFSFMAPSFVKRSLAVAILNYDLCPSVSIGKICCQINAAISWLRSQAEHFSLDKNAIHLLGHSAGGHLAAMMNSNHDLFIHQNQKAIKSIISVSGVHDLAPLVHTRLNQDLNLTRESAYKFSPINYKPLMHIPLTVVVGKNESSEFKRQSKLIKQYYQNNNLPVDFREITSTNHFTILDQMINYCGASYFF